MQVGPSGAHDQVVEDLAAGELRMAPLGFEPIPCTIGEFVVAYQVRLGGGFRYTALDRTLYADLRRIRGETRPTTIGYGNSMHV